MHNAVIAALVEQEVQARLQMEIIDECPNENEPVMDGTGEHLGLRDPWWNSGIHSLTDATWFRWLLIIIVIDNVRKWF